MTPPRTEISDTAGPPLGPSDSPTLADLRSTDPRTSEAAWRKAYPLLWDAALRLLHIVLAGADHNHDREDIAAQAISELVRSLIEKNLPSFNQIESFGDLVNMARQIVRARTKDFFRQRSRRQENLTAEPPEMPLEMGGSSTAPARGDFDTLIARLPPPQPEIFRLHYGEGRTAEEISSLLGSPRGTILCHLSRGRKTLRQFLDGTVPPESRQSTTP